MVDQSTVRDRERVSHIRIVHSSGPQPMCRIACYDCGSVPFFGQPWCRSDTIEVLYLLLANHGVEYG